MKDYLTILCVGVLTFGAIGTMWFYQYPHSQVYACRDVDTNPVEINELCKKLTRGQWWAHDRK